MNRILLAYCRDNAPLAAEIDRKLSRIGIPFEHITDQEGAEQGYMANYLSGTPEPVLLLVTDNFLKSAGCMSGMLAALQTMMRDRRVVTVVADGVRREDGAEVPTHFDRMVYALQYMNHWQSTWLELSDRHSHADGAAKEAMLDELNATRNIANEMGDLISALRESGHITYPEFESHEFAAFFQRFGLQHWHEQYKHITAQEAVPAETTLANMAPEDLELPTLQVSGDMAHSNGHELPTASVSMEPDSTAEVADAPHFDKMDDLLQHLEQEEQPAEVAIPYHEPETTDLPTLEPSPEPVTAITTEDVRSAASADAGDEDVEAIVAQHINDAWFWLENGHTERGLELLSAALEQYPDNTALQASLEQARAQYEPAAAATLASSPSLPVAEVVPAVMPQLMNSEARSYELMGDMAMQKGDFLFAKYCWDRTVELESAYPGIYRKLGMMVTENLREYRETGMQYLKKALAQNPADAEVHLALARVALQNNEPEAAEVYYRSAVAADPPLKTLDNDLLFLPEYALQTQEKQEAPVVVVTESPQEEERVAEVVAALLQEEASTAWPIDAAPETILETPAGAMPDAEFSDTGSGSGAENVHTPEVSDSAAVSSINGNAVETEVPEEAPSFESEMGMPLPSLPDQTGMPAVTTSEMEIPGPETAPEGHLAPESVVNPMLQPESAAAEPQALPSAQAPVPAQEVLTVLITGATSGIGLATAELFARNGHRLILTGRRVDRLSDLKRHFESETQTDVLMLPFDVRDLGAVRAALENLPEAWQTVDVLINNAGLAKGLAPIQEGELDHWETMIDTNIKGLLYVTRVVAPGMVRRRRGHIVNIGSIAGKEIYPSGNVYCASKAAVDALTRAMRLDLHAHNIRVSQISPGHVEETEFAVNRFDGDAERGAKVYENFQPLKASDVAEVIYFMVTRPAHVNIQDVVLYGTQQASATVIDRSGRG